MKKTNPKELVVLRELLLELRYGILKHAKLNKIIKCNKRRKERKGSKYMYMAVEGDKRIMQRVGPSRLVFLCALCVFTQKLFLLLGSKYLNTCVGTLQRYIGRSKFKAWKVYFLTPDNKMQLHPIMEPFVKFCVFT